MDAWTLISSTKLMVSSGVRNCCSKASQRAKIMRALLLLECPFPS
jgi:hypothetical protein